MDLCFNCSKWGFHLQFSQFSISCNWFVICRFVQSAEELFMQKHVSKRLLKSTNCPAFVIIFNSLFFAALHLFNNGMSILPFIVYLFWSFRIPCLYIILTVYGWQWSTYSNEFYSKYFIGDYQIVEIMFHIQYLNWEFSKKEVCL